MRKKHRETFLIQLAIITTLLVFAGYITLYLYATTGEEGRIKLTEDACNDLGGTCRESCYSNEEKRTRCEDTMVCCIEIYADSPTDKLFLQEAIKNKDTTDCKLIYNEAVKASCKLQVMDAINLDFALKYEDEKYCELINDENKAAECYSALAEQIKDPDMCENIKLLGLRNKCLANLALISSDSMICLNKISSEVARTACVKEIAIKTMKLSYCDQIYNEDEANDCKLDIELRMLTEGYTDCIRFSESECKEEDWCAPLYFTPECDGCTEKMFEICLPNNEKICEQSFGSWNLLTLECNCYENVWFGGFGCYSCEEFSQDFSKQECLKRKES